MPDKEKIEAFLYVHARELDQALYSYQVGRGSGCAVIAALQPYQNDDGGFGRALEPDLFTLCSTAIATTVGFQYLIKVGATAEDDIVCKGIAYFKETFDSDLGGWPIVVAAVADAPHAPWWTYNSDTHQLFDDWGWGNPSSEILGYLCAFDKLTNDDVWLDQLEDLALKRLHNIQKPEFHELAAFQRLYFLADRKMQESLFNPLAKLIDIAVEKDISKWEEYGATPLTFVHSPASPFAEIFSETLIEKNLEILSGQIVNDDHWEPHWHWRGAYPESWEYAKKLWSGVLTVKNALLMQKFGVL